MLQRMQALQLASSQDEPRIKTRQHNARRTREQQRVRGSNWTYHRPHAVCHMPQAAARQQQQQDRGG